MHRELSEVLSNEYSIVSDLGEDTLSMVSTVPSETEGEDKKSCACTFIFWGAFIGLCGIIGISRKAFLKNSNSGFHGTGFLVRKNKFPIFVTGLIRKKYISEIIFVGHNYFYKIVF